MRRRARLLREAIDRSLTEDSKASGRSLQKKTYQAYEEPGASNHPRFLACPRRMTTG